MTLGEILLLFIYWGVMFLLLLVIISIGVGLLALAVVALYCFFHFLIVKLINWFEKAEETLDEDYGDDKE